MAGRSTHAVWTVGFRPFFILAMFAGLSLPLLWALIFGGRVTAPAMPFSVMQWHAHEMFFGFGWAVLGGFLLTASKNWVSIRGYHGPALALLALAWLQERAGMWFAGSLPPLLFHISNNLFLVAVVAMLMATLIRHRRSDSYADNYFFLLVLPTFLLAKQLMLSTEYFQIGVSLALGLFRMAFLVMLERTLTPFMKAAFQVPILRYGPLDKSIKLLGLLMVVESLLPRTVSALLAAALALLLLGRFFRWQPQLALRRLDVGIMYLGYLAIVAQLLIHAADPFVQLHWVGTVSVHVFTFGVMGLIIPAMIVRISNGHTGRKVVFDGLDKTALWIMLLALTVRVVGPQADPAGYVQWIYLAAICWLACFSILAWRYIPFLLQPRVDGKEH
ncbi:NnrS [Denitratisoma sp. DHT3]|uniref:NnrS family protein n=1 Tax=Denitratisoma sp. DHT3 TaxID=1981880 RepID=UPI001198334C|nr:NnrS family protein [Denitratisoma sp. DHT3]QDX80474.1 NnrS [Denitratisoma sp. DHT3]